MSCFLFLFLVNIVCVFVSLLFIYLSSDLLGYMILLLTLTSFVRTVCCDSNCISFVVQSSENDEMLCFVYRCLSV